MHVHVHVHARCMCMWRPHLEGWQAGCICREQECLIKRLQRGDDVKGVAEQPDELPMMALRELLMCHPVGMRPS